MSTTVNTIRDLAERDYKWGFVTDIEDREYPQRAERRCHSADLRQEERTGVHAGVAAEGVPALGSTRTSSGAEVGQH